LLNNELNAITETTVGDAVDINSAISSAVQDATAAIPSRAEMSEAAANARYIPEPHTEEGTPLEDVYRLEDLVSEKELQACKIFAWDGLVKEGKIPESQYAFLFLHLSNILAQHNYIHPVIVQEKQ